MYKAGDLVITFLLVVVKLVVRNQSVDNTKQSCKVQCLRMYILQHRMALT